MSTRLSEHTPATPEEELALLRLQRAALEATATAIVITDRQGRIIWANRAFTALSGYELEEARGQNPADIVRSGQAPAELYASMWRTILAGEPWQGEMVNRRKDGSLYLEALTISPVRDRSGEVSHFIATKRDVSHEREVASRVHEAQKLDTVGRLAGGVAHEFNNLLSVINGGLDTLLDSLQVGAPMRAELLEVRHAGQRAAGLTQQLLAFGRGQVLRRVPLNFAEVVQEPLRLMAPLLGDRVRIETRLQSESVVMGDRGQLEQVFVNLVLNARDAMPQGGVLSVTTRDVDVDGRTPAAGSRGSQVPPAGRYAVLSVADSGTGMVPEVMAHIFEPFFTTRAVGAGIGLGLSTAYGVVHQCGGFIGVRTEVGRGSVFEVHLPVVHATPHVDESVVTRASILLVDDEEALLRLNDRILTRAGYEVFLATGGAEALELAARHAPDLVVTDVVMPHMSGGELVTELESRHPGIAVIFSSGFTTDAIVKRGVEAEQVAFLAKPYAPAELLALVRKVLAQRQAARAPRGAES